VVEHASCVVENVADLRAMIYEFGARRLDIVDDQV
jgi:hypothetical protein